jgi:hypothetical protein
LLPEIELLSAANGAGNAARAELLRTRAGFNQASMFQQALDPLSLQNIPLSLPAVANPVITTKKFFLLKKNR